MEMISADNKFLEGRTTSIGGKHGRAIRIPTRALAAADVLAKSLIQPMEIAAYAHRLGTSQGLQGTELENFIQKQLTDGNSKAYSWGRKRAQELTFQEDIPDFLNTLMALRESNSMVGKMMKIFLPFIKTPYNVLKQGLRKSPLGIIPLAKDTVNRLYNKKGFDGEYVAKAAEQLIAWSTVMAVMALNDDDDDKPFITGAAPAFGSGEYNFKANKVPPYSIKLLGKYWSYAGIEPFATQLGVIADGVKAVNEAQNGRDGTAIMKQLVSAVGQSITQKSFIDGIAEVIRVSQDPERELWKPVTNTAASVVPNIFRQVRQAFIDDVSDNKSRARGAEFLRDQFITVTNKMGILYVGDDFELVCETGYGVHYDGLLKNLEQGVRYVYENGDIFPDDCDNHEEDEPYWRYKNFTKFKIDSDCTITARYEYADVKLVIGEYQFATLNLDSDIGANLYDECLLIC
jgi:hypothetical protein